MVVFWVGLGFLGIAVFLFIAGQVTVSTAEKRLYSKGRAVVTAILIGDLAGVEPQVEFEAQGQIQKVTARKLNNRDGWLKVGQEVDILYRARDGLMGKSWTVYVQKPDGSDPMVAVTVTSKILYAVSALFALIGIALMGYYMFVLKN